MKITSKIKEATMLGQAGRSNNNTAESFHVAEIENPMTKTTALSTKQMFDNLKDMFDFIMQKMDRLEGKIDSQSEKLHTHVEDEENTLAKHSVYLNLIIWISGIIAVALIGGGISWAFGLIK